MSVHTVLQMATVSGTRTFEVQHLDVGKLDETFDILVVSAFAQNYEPTPTSIVGALWRDLRISVGELAEDPELDLRPVIPAWLSREIPDSRIARILCVEAPGNMANGQRLRCLLDGLRDALAVAAVRGLSMRRLLVPLVGAGDQGLAPQELAQELVPCLRALADGVPALDRIVLFSHKRDSVERLARALDETLGRNDVRVNEALRADLRQTVAGVREHLTKQLAQELDAALSPGDTSPVALLVCARNVAEAVADSFPSTKKAPDLYARIEALSQHGVSPWILSYLHALRTIGNAAAHVARMEEKRLPVWIEQRDVELCLFCLQRVLAFWRSVGFGGER